MFHFIKRHHGKAMLSVPLLFLLTMRGEIPEGNSVYIKPITYFPEIGSPFGVELNFRSTVAINATDGTMHFPPFSLAVDRVDIAKSSIDLWGANPEWSNKNGVVTWSGGIIKPVTKNGRQDGNIARIIMVAKSSTPLKISVDEATLLENNGRGDDVLTGRGAVTIFPRLKGSPSPDVDGDRVLSTRDIAQVVIAMSKKYDKNYDLNMDRVIDFKDVSLMLDYYSALK